MNLVKDVTGNVLQGITKDSLGSLVVKNDSEYRKYLHSKEQSEKLNRMCKEIDELKMLITELINRQKG
jgi:hypothetical protein